MTTAATITANLVLNSKDFQSNVKKAENTFSTFSKRVGSQIKYLREEFRELNLRVMMSSLNFNKMGNTFIAAGNRMTMFISVPIIGFFALLIKKAMDADTAISKLAKESVDKLNTSLAQLGEKFLPLFIKFIDYIIKLVDGFLALPPGTQAFITKLVLLAAMAGPLTSFAGVLMKIFFFFSAAGVGGKAVDFIIGVLIPSLKIIGSTIWTSLVPSIGAAGTAIWGALLPLLPVLALIAASVLLVYLLWKNWGQLSVIVSQLWAIIKWEFSQGWADIKQKTKQGLDWFNAEWKKSNKTWENNQKQWNQIQTKLFQLAMDAMHKAVMDVVAKMSAKFMEFRNRAINTWNSISSAFRSVFSGIANYATSVFKSIISGIGSVIDAVDALITSLGNIVFPDELTPGSPTPFEMGLRGITKAMDILSKQSIPELNHSFATPSGVSTVGTGKTINITDNRRFAGGLDAKTLRTALDERFLGLAEALEAAA